MQEFSISPASAVLSLLRYRELIAQLTWREVAGRYRGSFAGLLWSFLNPLLSLAMYTFVFGVVLKARWAEAGETTFDFALLLFAGLVVHALLAECISRAPNLILGNPTYVKQVVFPLDVLPVVALCSSLFHAAISMGLLVFAWALYHGSLHLAALFIPMLLLPLCLVALGCGWFLSSSTVYFRDIGQVVNFIVTGLMFFSPIFYPASAVPEPFRLLLQFNPLTFIVESLRGALIAGTLPSASAYIIYCFISLIIAFLGYAWFQRIRSGFGDVI